MEKDVWFKAEADTGLQSLFIPISEAKKCDTQQLRQLPMRPVATTLTKALASAIWIGEKRRVLVFMVQRRAPGAPSLTLPPNLPALLQSIED